MSIFLNRVKKGTSVIVVGFSEKTDQKIKRRLLELGFLKDTVVTLSEISFLKEVLLMELNGYTISLRSDIAKNIQVKEIGDKK